MEYEYDHEYPVGTVGEEEVLSTSTAYVWRWSSVVYRLRGGLLSPARKPDGSGWLWEGGRMENADWEEGLRGEGRG